MTRARLRNLRIDEFSLVDKACQEPAKAVILKRAPENKPPEAAVMKRGRLTGDADGHSHLYDDGAESGTTSYDYSCDGHAHPYVVEDGVVTIGMAAGHAHEVRAATAMTTDKAAPRGATAQEPTAMTIDADRIKTLEADLAKAQTRASMSDGEKAHADRLTGDALPAYLAKSATDRKAEAAELTEVVYKAANGDVFTRGDDQRMVEMAKRTDAAEAKVATVDLTKRAAAVFKVGKGTADVHAAILGAIEKHITDEGMRAKAIEVLKANDFAGSGAFESRGFSGGEPDANSAQARLDAKVEKFADDRKISKGKALLAITKANGPDTDEDARDLYAEAQSERVAAN